MYDFLIAGAGLFGSTFARIVSDAGGQCLVIDKVDYIGGMASDERIHGINVCRHGAHIFHTHSPRLWHFINRFGKFNNFTNRVKAAANGRLYSFPINLMTLNELWGVTTPTEASATLQQVRIPCARPRNLEEWALSLMGRELYELFFYGYTKKHWQREPAELPASIAKRLPFRLTHDDNYYTGQYQGVPVDGYTPLVTTMLSGIRVELGVNLFTLDWRRLAKQLVYTGPIDEFYRYRYGRLEYISLNFERRVYAGDHQSNAVINHCDYEVRHIRSIEHKHFACPPVGKDLEAVRDGDPTVVTYDFPARVEDTGAPYYPIRDERNLGLYARYEALKERGVVFGGRLGEYRYYDMDQTIASAMQKARAAINTSH